MINFEEELKKFHPSLEVEDAVDSIYNQDLTDVADLLIKMIKESEEKALYLYGQQALKLQQLFSADCL